FLDQPDRLEFELSAKCSSRSQLLTPVSSSHFNKVSTGTAAAQLSMPIAQYSTTVTTKFGWRLPSVWQRL
ncbi:hypothetical protein, partial [Cupriavidus campinensis]|uniref:hypothetical protein n=1 Tax=Cupriavidus campinensis TaxID=151783 RepID=UPI001C923AE8